MDDLDDDGAMEGQLNLKLPKKLRDDFARIGSPRRRAAYLRQAITAYVAVNGATAPTPTEVEAYRRFATIGLRDVYVGKNLPDLSELISRAD